MRNDGASVGVRCGKDYWELLQILNLHFGDSDFELSFGGACKIVAFS